MTVAPHPTLEDVARLAGVSLGSASRALSVPDEVRPATLERVQRAVEQLGYVRNGAARALASRRTHTVATIYPTLDNPIFSQSIQALQETLFDLGYQLLVASHNYMPQCEVLLLQTILERGVDAVVLVGTDHDDAVFSLLRQYQLPLVLTWSLDDEHRRNCVGFSYYDAAYEMAELVIRQGHTDIALCAGPSYRNERVRARLAATKAALKNAGLDLRPEWIVEQPFSFEGGRQAMRQVLSGPRVPSVLICGTDLHAVGALSECHERGINVPGEFSITGSDDIELASIVDPKLTTVHVPMREIGVRAAQRVVALIEGRETPLEERLSARVVVRGSLGAPRAD